MTEKRPRTKPHPLPEAPGARWTSGSPPALIAPLPVYAPIQARLEFYHRTGRPDHWRHPYASLAPDHFTCEVFTDDDADQDCALSDGEVTILPCLHLDPGRDS